MIKQVVPYTTKTEQKRTVVKQVKAGHITLAGNKKLKIYGKLHCASGTRMKPENRVFFSIQAEARQYGYRPCGHCMQEQYKQWKKGSHNSLWLPF